MALCAAVLIADIGSFALLVAVGAVVLAAESRFGALSTAIAGTIVRAAVKYSGSKARNRDIDVPAAGSEIVIPIVGTTKSMIAKDQKRTAVFSRPLAFLMSFLEPC